MLGAPSEVPFIVYGWMGTGFSRGKGVWEGACDLAGAFKRPETGEDSASGRGQQKTGAESLGDIRSFFQKWGRSV